MYRGFTFDNFNNEKLKVAREYRDACEKASEIFFLSESTRQGLKDALMNIDRMIKFALEDYPEVKG